MHPSASDPLVFADVPASRGGATSGRGGWKLHLALAGAGANLVILALFAAFFSASLSSLQASKAASDGQQAEAAHLVIDNGQVPGCAKNPTIGDLPCLQRDGRYLTSERHLGPWKCISSYSGGGRGKCPVANNNGSRIEVSRQGVYMIVAQTVIVDSLPSPVVLLISVNDKIWAACAQNATGSQLSCTVATARRLQSGDWLTVQLPQAYRLIDSHFTITYVDLVRLSE